MVDSKNKRELIALGHWLKACRERSRISISEIADALHMDPEQVIELESGRVDEKMLEILSQVYGVPHKVVLIKLHIVRRRLEALKDLSDGISIPS